MYDQKSNLDQIMENPTHEQAFLQKKLLQFDEDFIRKLGSYIESPWESLLKNSRRKERILRLVLVYASEC